MASTTVSIGTDGIKEPSIDSIRMLNIIAADQAGVMNLTIDTNLKQNSEFFVHKFWSRISPSREVLGETRLFEYHGQGEQMQFFFRCPEDHIIRKWAYQILKLRSNALFLKFGLEGEYSPKGGGNAS